MFIPKYEGPVIAAFISGPFFPLTFQRTFTNKCCVTLLLPFGVISWRSHHMLTEHGKIHHGSRIVFWTAHIWDCYAYMTRWWQLEAYYSTITSYASPSSPYMKTSQKCTIWLLELAWNGTQPENELSLTCQFRSKTTPNPYGFNRNDHHNSVIFIYQKKCMH